MDLGEVVARLVSDRPCLSWSAYNIGNGLGTLDVLLIYRVLANGMGRNPLERAGTVLSLALGAQP